MEDVNDLEMQMLVASPRAENHAGGGSSAIQMLKTAILVVQSLQMFLAGTNHGSSPEQDENARNEDIEEVAVDVATADQTVPLLGKVDYNLPSWKPIRTLVCVIRFLLAFKAQERKPEVGEASDSQTTDQIIGNEMQCSTSRSIHNLSRIVREKNLKDLKEFGGLGRVESALDTDLINGISKNKALIRRQPQAVSISLDPTHTFLHLVWKEFKEKTIILLLLAVIASTVLGIKEEGIKYAYYDAVIVIIAIILQVFIASIRKYLEEKRTQKKLQKQQFEEGGVGKVLVKRGDETEEINELELVYGDLVLLKKGDEVPCDGLFVGGEELLELDYGNESCIINQQNPFLSYGEIVKNGDAIMVATSTNMETEWGEMMNKSMGDPNTWFKLETQLKNLNNCMHVIQIISSILIILVLSFRCMARKMDDYNAYRPESICKPTSTGFYLNTFGEIIKKSAHISKVATKLVSVSLVGLTEGVPFVVSLAINYWNEKTLCEKATEQDPYCVAKMASVTRICTDTFIIEDGMKNMKKEDTNEQIRELRKRGIQTVIVSRKKMSSLQEVALIFEAVTNGGSESSVITGEDFRKYTNEERLEKVDNIRVLGEALPSDKLLLVETMREKGEVVAYLGQRTDEAPALKRANIGVAMGTWSSKQAKENCDIIMKDESFFHIISMVDSGKCIKLNIQSFLQLLLITTISSTLISFIETAAFGDASLTLFQLAWVHFAVSFLGGLALLTKPSTDNSAHSVPISCGQSIITTEMTRNILSQVMFMDFCSVIIQRIGPSHFKKAVVSNIFMLCQFFNLFIAREQQKKNFFRGIHRHKVFWVAIAVCIILHVVIVKVQDVLGYGTRLKWKLWVDSVLLGLVTWLVDWLAKCISWLIKTYICQ
ncbi:hypothetical protein E3N88_42770 [Mikania micrantha]|uniref:Uncharacterized protein n=1 Tax=Mikania micrantha TaxID=192012 RepID=A0A5N6LGT2_9ASTR|nr:hypothetical protein E3N88_42770 [Mikania micrantha]